MRRQIGQALTNLLKNAAEAIEGRASRPMAADEPPGEIRSALRESDDDCRIIVEDNGHGLPRQGRERLTEPYVTTRAQGHRPRPRHRQEDHGRSRRRCWRWTIGRVAAPSVRLIFRQSRAARHAPVETDARTRSVGRRMAADILIVDDEADIRMLIGGILNDEGYATRDAGNSDEALAAIRHAAAEPGDPRHLAAGQRPRRPADPRGHQARVSDDCRS